MDSRGDRDPGTERGERPAPGEQPASYGASESVDPLEAGVRGGHAPTLGEIAGPWVGPPQGRPGGPQLAAAEGVLDEPLDAGFESLDCFSVVLGDFSDFSDFSDVPVVVEGASSVVLLRLSLR